MMKRLQAARKKMLAIHAHGEKLEPVVLQSPFMNQEFDLLEPVKTGRQIPEGESKAVSPIYWLTGRNYKPKRVECIAPTSPIAGDIEIIQTQNVS